MEFKLPDFTSNMTESSLMSPVMAAGSKSSEQFMLKCNPHCKALRGGSGLLVDKWSSELGVALL